VQHDPLGHEGVLGLSLLPAHQPTIRSVPDPGCLFRIPDPGSNNNKGKEDKKGCLTFFFLQTQIHKI
jgi:hypothetical protein